MISVDTKKKERVGNFKNGGRKWRKKGQAPKVSTHDFPSLGEGTAIPYGTYDVQRNEGMVNVGMTHDTAEFAVESVPVQPERDMFRTNQEEKLRQVVREDPLAGSVSTDRVC